MMQEWVYGFDVRFEEGSFHAFASTAPEAIAWGATREEAVREMGGALTAAVRGRMKLGLDLAPPAPAAEAERDTFVLPAALAAKATIYAAWKASGLSKVALANRLDCAEKEARRLLDPDHPSSLDRMDAAARALGIDLVIGGRPAPIAEAA